MPSFRFLDPGPLVDAELQLVPPNQGDVEAVLAACRHPQTLAQSPELARVTRTGLSEFLTAAPGGMHSGDLAAGRVPSYHFWMKLIGSVPVIPAAALGSGGMRIAGGISLRIGDTADLRLYVGHVGYHVYPPYRGHRYAERATRLLLPLARHHGLRELWITANPENAASCATCERLGAALIDTIPLPPQHQLYQRGDRLKCRYRLAL
jgi:tagatose 1,6-diphosphate aldolase